MFCSECGHNNTEGEQFCSKCGKELTDNDQLQMPKRSKMKRFLAAAGICLGVIAVVLFIWYRLSIFDYPAGVSAAAIAAEAENIDFNSDSGLLYVNNEIVVMTHDGVTIDQVKSLAKDFDAEILTAMTDIGFYQFKFSKAMTYDELSATLDRIRESDIVERAYFNSVCEVNVNALPFYPDDPYGKNGKDIKEHPVSWNMDVPRGRNWGMDAIRAPAAWGYLDEMSEVRLGFIDFPPSQSHEDLKIERILFLSTLIGIDYNPNTNQELLDPDWEIFVASPSHGSHVGGIMGAEFDNDKGVSGVMGDKGKLYYAQSYVVTANNHTAVYTLVDTIVSLMSLIKADVKVINRSMGYNDTIVFAASRGNRSAQNFVMQESMVLEDALKRIIRNNEYEFVICVAAGNSNVRSFVPYDEARFGFKILDRTSPIWEKMLPYRKYGDVFAKYSSPLAYIEDKTVRDRIIVVGSIGIDKQRSTNDRTEYRYSSFSNVGDRIDIVAPGEDIYSTYVRGYGYMTGTSMASPHVAGVAGLVFAVNPDLTGAQVKQILLESTVGRFNYSGGHSGLIDAELAVMNALKTR